MTTQMLRTLPDPLPNSEVQSSDGRHLVALAEAEYEPSMLILDHSCEPNVGFGGNTVPVAMRDIQRGEELTTDYALFDDYDRQISCACACGTSRCRRRRIHGRDSIASEEVQLLHDKDCILREHDDPDIAAHRRGQARQTPQGDPQGGGSIHNAFTLSYYVYMTSLLQIRDVPEDARRGLKARAAARGQSLNAYLLDIIDREVSRPTVAEVLERAAQRAERGSTSAADAVAAGRAERDRRLTDRPRT